MALPPKGVNGVFFSRHIRELASLRSRQKDRQNVGLDEFYQFLSLISDLCKNPAVLSNVDMQLYYPLEFVADICRA